MSRQAQAELILRLYEIRHKENLTEARNWFSTEFNPQSAQEIVRLKDGGHRQNNFYEMVTTYWDMVCAFVIFEAIDERFFHATQVEHLAVFAKIEPFLAELKELFGLPDYLDNLERIARNAPNAEEYFVKIRGAVKYRHEAKPQIEK